MLSFLIQSENAISLQNDHCQPLYISKQAGKVTGGGGFFMIRKPPKLA